MVAAKVLQSGSSSEQSDTPEARSIGDSFQWLVIFAKTWWEISGSAGGSHWPGFAALGVT